MRLPWRWLVLAVVGLPEVQAAIDAVAKLPEVQAQVGGVEPSLVGGECQGQEKEWAACGDIGQCPSLCKSQDCEFSDWSDWFSLGGCIGLCTRQRDIKQSNNECGRPCMGAKVESIRREDCLPESCHYTPTDCQWSSWSEWSQCVGNELGQSFRVRRVHEPAKGGGVPCAGGWNETRSCSEPSVQNCSWSAWTEWTACTATCGGGTKAHARRIMHHAERGGMPCEGAMRESATCADATCGNPEKCVVSQWSPWDGCEGKYPDRSRNQRFRMRRIVVPSRNGDETCDYPLVETVPCPNKAPPSPPTCSMTTWSDWTSCSATCDGQHLRSRTVDMSNSSDGCLAQMKVGSQMHELLKEVMACGPRHCQELVQSRLSGWTEWAICSNDCGLGYTERVRKIEQPGAGGLGDGLALKEVKGCMKSDCDKVDCKWALWEAWSACSCTCGGGTKRRNRVVEDAPRHGGTLCTPDDKSEVGPCNTQSCDFCVDGLWGSWGAWSHCSASCGGAFRVRHRDVEQRPNSCGTAAVGLEDDFRLCPSLPSCEGDVDCKLDVWAPWSACSCECFGVKERHRRVLQFAVGHGKSCVDESLKEVSPCNPGPGEEAAASCGPLPKRSCSMSEWADWGECSASCDGGQRERARHVLTPQAHGGEPCSGSLTSLEPCGLASCTAKVCKDCSWGDWSDWGDCSKCGGQRYRTRAILHMPDECGRKCDPKVAKEVDMCESHCEMVGYCTWSEWSGMGDCSATCGTAMKMRQRQLTLEDEPPKAQTELVGVGKCLDKLGQHYKSFNIPSVITEKGCRSLLQDYADHGLRGLQFSITAGKGSCQILTDRGLEFNMSRVVAEVADMDGTATGAVGQSDKSPGYLCWRVASGAFFVGDRSMPCSGSQVDLEACPQRSCQLCEAVDCSFAEWAEWSAPSCTQLCERHRVILHTNACGGAACDGTLVETKQCAKDCDDLKDCEFSDWSLWTNNMCQQDLGQRARERRQLQPAVNGGKPCSGALLETAPCPVSVALKEAPIDCLTGEWRQWSKCTASCGTGQHTRTRAIVVAAARGGKACSDDLSELENCNTLACSGGEQTQDCLLGQWNDWNDCTTDGLRYRHRSIIQPPLGSGSPCEGSLSDGRICDGPEDCVNSPWSDWDSCDRTCGGGQQFRQRHVMHNPCNGGAACSERLEETIGCNQASCKVTSCEVSPWSDWGACSISCGSGEQLRSRFMTQMPQACGVGCDDDLAEAKSCRAVSTDCHGPMDCLWALWSDWSGCTCDCAGGQRTRERRIDQVPVNGGKSCTPQDKEEIEPCNTQPCGSGACIDGKWAEWTKWEACTKTCDGGITWRMRKVESQATTCGRPAVGDSTEHAGCNSGVPCQPDIDCVFGDWEQWSGCTTPCSGIKRRSRVISVQGQRSGKWCEGPLKETSPCDDDKECAGGLPLDCEIAPWHLWAVCSSSCGQGQRTRSRDVLHENRHGGLPCNNALVETAGCVQKTCDVCAPVDCNWGDWEMWSACDKCGGQRKRYRHIEVQPECGGKACTPQMAEEMGNCTRQCHSETYCAWEDWQNWEACSVTCGDLGRKSRVRYLKAYDQPHAIAAAALETSAGGLVNIEAKFEELKQRAQGVEVRRVGELGTAFLLGTLSFAGLLAMGKRLSRGLEAPIWGVSRHRYEAAPTNEYPLRAG